MMVRICCTGLGYYSAGFRVHKQAENKKPAQWYWGRNDVRDRPFDSRAKTYRPSS
jgi:hypothetical protein